MASRKNPLSKQERANARAQAWGFKNDYQFRNWAKQNGIVGLRGSNRDAKILDSLDNPKQFAAARKSGNLARGLAGKGALYYDTAAKTKRPLTPERFEKYIQDLKKRDKEKVHYWRIPDRLRTRQDYEKLILLAMSDYTDDAYARVQALFYTMVLHNGYTVAEFAAKYRDAIIEAGLDPSDLDAFMTEMFEDYA